MTLNTKTVIIIIIIIIIPSEVWLNFPSALSRLFSFFFLCSKRKKCIRRQLKITYLPKNAVIKT